MYNITYKCRPPKIENFLSTTLYQSETQDVKTATAKHAQKNL